MRLFMAVLAVVGICAWPSLAQHRAPDGEGAGPSTSDEISPEERERIKSAIKANLSRLKSQDRLPPVEPRAAPSAGSLGWPLRLAPAGQGYGYHAISNYVDLNSTLNAVRDWNCGSRSYDTASTSYNHGGIDMVLWPFSWRMMDREEVRVVAAAAGTIVAKSDGNYDRNCSMESSSTANAVYVRHGDGSVAWYLHLKNGSVTSKAVGASVTRGEYLGVVGSSGSSTVPHLHFEIHDENDNVLEPFTGTCNAGSSLWAVQPAYNDSAINLIATHSAAPVFPTCPTQETPNFSNDFVPGDRVYFATYFRDRLSTQTATYTVYKPDGSVYSTWTHAPTTDHYSVYYAYWYFTLPSSSPTGIWRFKATYNGADYEHRFRLGTTTTLVTPQSGWWWNASESGRGFSLELRGNNVFLSSYLYASDASSVWYIATGALSGNTFEASLQQFGGGQVLNGSFQTASLAGIVGTVTIVFTSATTATMTWPGGTVALERYNIVSGGVSAGTVADMPETGWWWSTAEPGRGYFAEIQGSTLFPSGYMYDSHGQATWFVSQNSMTEPLTYQGSLQEFAGGQTLTGAYQAPTTSTDRGSLTIQFTSATDGVVTFPGGSQIALTRYRF